MYKVRREEGEKKENEGSRIPDDRKKVKISNRNRVSRFWWCRRDSLPIKLLKENFPRSKFEFDNYSQEQERLAFDVNFMDNTNILEYSAEEKKNE